jgi:lysozyme
MIKSLLSIFVIAYTVCYQTTAMENIYKPLDTMTVSERGLRLIERFEGFRGEIYICPGGKPTIGYGHVVKDHERGLFSNGITPQGARALLIADLNDIYVVGLKRQVSVRLTQYQFDVLASFIYNLGEDNLCKSTLLTRLNEKEYAQAAPQFPRWCHAKKDEYMPGLFKRRIAEMFIFQNAPTLPDELKIIKRAEKETLFELWEALDAKWQEEALQIYLEYFE